MGQSPTLLQIVYAALLIGSYTAFFLYAFPLLPNPAVGTIHIHIGGALTLATFASFVLASVADPGAVTLETSTGYMARYPPDGIIFQVNMCRTCQCRKPARSKHCPACGRCVPKFDHHCGEVVAGAIGRAIQAPVTLQPPLHPGWVNNCIGERNQRWFLLFLALTTALCSYGGWLGSRILQGEMQLER